MRHRWFMLGALALCLTPMAAAAQEIIPDVEYFGGKDGFTEKEKGVLLVSVDGVKFTRKDGSVIFEVPMASITQVERSTDIRDASVGKKLLFGSLAGSRKQDFITVSTESSTTAEAIVFKLKQNAGSAAAAKINFYRKKAGMSVSEDSTGGATQSNPQPPR